MNGAVFKGAAEAATLASEGRDTVFRYRADYSGPAVSSTLPLGKVEPHGGRGVPTYFANLLPEGHRLGALRNQVKTSGATVNGGSPPSTTFPAPCRIATTIWLCRWVAGRAGCRGGI